MRSDIHFDGPRFHQLNDLRFRQPFVNGSMSQQQFMLGEAIVLQ